MDGRDCTRAFPKSSFHGQFTPDNLRHARPAVNRNFVRGSIAADTRLLRVRVVLLVRTIGGRISFPTDSKHMRPTRGAESARHLQQQRVPHNAHSYPSSTLPQRPPVILSLPPSLKGPHNDASGSAIVFEPIHAFFYIYIYISFRVFFFL